MSAELLVLTVASIVSGLIIYQLTKKEDIALDRNISDKLKELPPLFRNARNNIKIATDFDSRFFGNDIVKQALKEAYNCHAKISIISEKEIDSVLLNYYTEIAEIRRVPKLSQHIMIIDSSNLRLEKPHCGRDFGKEKDDVAYILSGFPEMAKKTEVVFDEVWTSTLIS